MWLCVVVCGCVWLCTFFSFCRDNFFGVQGCACIRTSFTERLCMISFSRIRKKLKARAQAKPKAKAKAKAKAVPKACQCLRCLWEAYDWRYTRCEAFGLRCPSPPHRGCRTSHQSPPSPGPPSPSSLDSSATTLSRGHLGPEDEVPADLFPDSP